MAPQVRLADAKVDRLTHSTFALLISNGSGAFLGVTFWAVAARLYTRSEVGNGVLAVTAMTLCANIGLLNLTTVFPRFLYPAGAKAGILLRRGYGASISLALLATLVFFAIAPHQGYIAPGWASHLFFLEGVLLWLVFTIEDPALIGLRRPSVVPIENTSFSVGKIVLLPVFLVVARSQGVFDSWVLPVAACVVVVNFYLFGYVLPRHIESSGIAGVLPSRRALTSFVGAEYVGGLMMTALWTLPALFVGYELGATQVANFQIPWVAATSFDLLLFSFATSLVAESSSRPSHAANNVRRAVRLAALIMGPALLLLVLGAPYFLDVLGTQYSRHGTWEMRYLLLALPFMGVNVLYVTFARLSRRARRLVLTPGAIAGTILVLMYFLIKPLGLTGVGVAFLAGQALVGVALLPSVVRQYRRADMASSHAADEALVLQEGVEWEAGRQEVATGPVTLVDPPR